MIDVRIILLCCILLIAGCTEGGEPSVEIVFDLGSSNGESRQFTADGQIRAQAHLTNQEFTFGNVSIVAYDENREKIGSRRVGEITTRPGENTVNVSITASSTPDFILIESPDFWHSEIEISVSGYKRTDTNYVEFKYTSRSDRFQEGDT